jgi:Domain of unknown function (DUF4158)
VFSSEVFSSGEGTPVATRDVFSEDELAQLRGFPEPARAELIRYFTLAPADEAFAPKFRGQDNVMGVAVQLCTLPWLGFVPDDVAAAPAAVVARLSEKLGIPVGALRGYGAREQTRTGHLREVAGTWAGGRSTGPLERPGGVPVRAGDGARLAEAAAPAGL